MRGSAKKKAVARLITIRLLGFNGKALQGLWTWSLVQQLVEEGTPPTVTDVKLVGSDDATFNLQGRFPAAFNESPSDVSNESFEFHLDGEIFPSIQNMTPIRGSGLPSTDNLIHFKVPRAMIRATVTISASTNKNEITSKTGKEASDSWKVGGSVSPSGEGETKWKGWEFTLKIVGTLSGEMSKNEIQTDATTQSWTLVYYTGGFEQMPGQIVVD